MDKCWTVKAAFLCKKRQLSLATTFKSWFAKVTEALILVNDLQMKI